MKTFIITDFWVFVLFRWLYCWLSNKSTAFYLRVITRSRRARRCWGLVWVTFARWRVTHVAGWMLMTLRDRSNRLRSRWDWIRLMPLFISHFETLLAYCESSTAFFCMCAVYLINGNIPRKIQYLNWNERNLKIFRPTGKGPWTMSYSF